MCLELNGQEVCSIVHWFRPLHIASAEFPSLDDVIQAIVRTFASCLKLCWYHNAVARG